jgi:hypothetical protein
MEPVEKSDPGNEEVEPEELRSAADVIQHLTKTLKTLKLYLPNNPIYQKFLLELLTRFGRHLQEYDSMRLRIRQYEMTYGGKTVYQNDNRLESLAFKLYVDGMRELIFNEGLTIEELTDFLEILGREHDPSSPDDDLITLLWERGLTHITFTVSEDFIAGTSQPAPSQASTPVTGWARQETAAAQKVSAAPQEAAAAVMDIVGPRFKEQRLGQIFTLTPPEIEELKRRMKAEEAVHYTENLLRMLAAILKADNEEKAFFDTVEILEGLLTAFLQRGEFGPATKVLRLFREMMKQGVSEHNQKRLLTAVQRMGERDRILMLEGILNKGTGEMADVMEYLLALEPNAILPLADLLGDIRQIKVRRMLCDTLAQLAKDHVEMLARRLDDERWYVARNVVYILGRIGDTRVLERFRRLLRHPEPKVRKEVIHAITGMKDARVQDMLVAALSDADKSTRTLVVQALTRAGGKEALHPLQVFLETRDLGSFEPHERKELFETVGRIGGNEVVPWFETFLAVQRLLWLTRIKNEDLGLCAVAGLKRVGTPDAREVLRRAKSRSTKLIQEACGRVLDEMERI